MADVLIFPASERGPDTIRPIGRASGIRIDKAAQLHGALIAWTVEARDHLESHTAIMQLVSAVLDIVEHDRTARDRAVRDLESALAILRKK